MGDLWGPIRPALDGPSASLRIARASAEAVLSPVEGRQGVAVGPDTSAC